MTDAPAPAPMTALASRVGADADALDRELVEIDMLVTQAKSESARHEQRRAQAVEKGVEAEQVLLLTRRAAVMETQVEVLEGKRKALARYRDAARSYAQALGELAAGGGPVTLGAGVAEAAPVAGGAGQPLADDAALSPAMSRMILGAQEDLRREIARAMHDGPAQSLTNIVLQAQIVERIVARDPAAAKSEVGLLVTMVQQTLDATKSFIFDVRPMVLDDLGLVPTLRRGTRERGRKSGIAVEFDSFGTDRRLPMEVESAVFRILDEGLAGYLAGSPDHVSLRLDWAESLEATVIATRDVVLPRFGALDEAPAPEAGKDLPPALADMMEARKADREARVADAEAAGVVALPVATRREIMGRASSVGAAVTVDDADGSLHLVLPLAPLGDVPAEPAPAG